MNSKLEKLLQGHPGLWRGRDAVGNSAAGIKTGFAELDARLPGGGWPANALVEIVTAQWGIGELRLLLPAMARLSREQYWIVWITPPYIPFTPALTQADVDLSRVLVLTPEDSDKDILWSMEKVLRAAACGMALAWPKRLSNCTLRRLQLAAEAGHSLGVLFRPVEADTSPAALRIHLAPKDGALRVRILKARGGVYQHLVELKV